MKFEYDDDELSIQDHELPEGDDEVIHYCHTLAGHTLTIDPRFKIETTILPNTFIVTKVK